MAQKPEDFNLPMTAISRIIKDAMPSGIRVTHGAKVALSKAASVFVLYVTTGANGFAQEQSRRTLNEKDVFDALGDLDLDMLVQPLQEALDAFKKGKQSKKEEKEKKKTEPVELEQKSEEVTVKEIETITIDSSSEEENVSTVDSSSDGES